MRMTTEEAFVKVLQAHGIREAFGIIGSAFMPISDELRRLAPGPSRTTVAASLISVAVTPTSVAPPLRPALHSRAPAAAFACLIVAAWGMVMRLLAAG